MDGVLIVVRSRVTQQSVAIEMVDQLERAGARVLGVVLNRVKDESGMPYARALRGYSHYAYSSDHAEKRGEREKIGE